MTLPAILLTNLACIAGFVLLLWLISLIRRDASIVDIFWGAGFVLVAWMSAWANVEKTSRAWLLVAMVTIWGLRLAGYLAWRNLGKPEDYRYQAMRERHGKRFPIVSLVTVFGLQGRVEWMRIVPFILLHAACLLVLVVGWSWIAVAMAVGAYFARVFGLTAFYHATFGINSLAHPFGSRRYETKDDSRNNFWLALITFGEGWHNNHHYFPSSARQGFRWWEIDVSYYLLVIMSWFGLVWDLKPVPARVLDPSSRLPAKGAL